MAEVSTTAAGNKKGSPLGTFFLACGYLCLLFWISILLDEVQTSEAWMGMHIGVSLIPNWLVLWQPIQLVTGTLPADDIAPVIVGWIVELLVLGFTFAFEIGMLHAKKYNTKLAKAFGTLCIGALLYDGWTNWNSGFAHGDMAHQLMFVIGLAAGAVILPIIALAFFKLAHMEG